MTPQTTIRKFRRDEDQRGADMHDRTRTREARKQTIARKRARRDKASGQR